jgi:hypothetical protein
MAGLITRGFGRRTSGIPSPSPTPTPTPTTAAGADLLAAICAAYQANTTLKANLPGGIYTDEAPNRAPTGDYIVVEETSANLELKTSTSQIHDVRVRFKVYANDLDLAGQLGDDVTAAYKGVSFAWTGGTASPLVPRDRKHVKDPGRAIGTENVWHLRIDFQTRRVTS